MITESAQFFSNLEGLETAQRTFYSPAQVVRLRRWQEEKPEWGLRAWVDV